jgi:predicted CoA-binding protein
MASAGHIVTDEDELAEIVRSARTAAVIGMKDERTPDVPAFEVPQTVQKLGIRVIPVNPTIERSLGERAYPNVASVPESFDLVNVFRRSSKVAPHADEVLALPPERRPLVFWMQTGVVDEPSARALAAAGIRVVMDRCLGVYAASHRR